MEEEKGKICVGEDGACHISVPLWQELPQITVRLEDRFTGSFDGKHTLPEKTAKLMDGQKDV